MIRASVRNRVIRWRSKVRLRLNDSLELELKLGIGLK